MQSLSELVRRIVTEVASDGRQVIDLFSPQFFLWAGLLIPALVGLVLYQRRLYRLGRTEKLVPRKLALNAGLIAAMLGILFITLSAAPSPESRADLIPFRPLLEALSGPADTSLTLAVYGANILLFVPLGVLLPIRWRKLDSPAAILAASASISAAIEISQYLMDRGRVAQTDDVIFNALGGLAGWTLLYATRRLAGWFKPAQRKAPN